MLWNNQRESGNVSDQRGIGGKTLGVGGLVVGAIVYYFMGGNPLDYLAQNAGNVTTGPHTMQQQREAPRSDDDKKFVAVVLGETEDVWHAVFKQINLTYQEPKLVLFTQSVQSACGQASSAVGPFYCPGDHQVYLDLTFFKQLQTKLGAKGDFAEAYVIAHEVGHHVQNLLGVEKSIRRQQQAAGDSSRNHFSVIMELQADCLAGVWAKQTQDTKQVIENGDIEEAINAAAAVGDDRLQQASRGQVVPDSFTHGSSAQRVAAFKTGFGGGQLQACLDNYR